LVYKADSDIQKAISEFAERITHNALIVDLSVGDASQFETEIEGHKFAINIEKA